jgi:hypothetical protein
MVTLAGVTGSLGLFWVVRRTFGGFLFERPHCVRLASVKPRVLSPAR